MSAVDGGPGRFILRCACLQKPALIGPLNPATNGTKKGVLRHTDGRRSIDGTTNQAEL